MSNDSIINQFLDTLSQNPILKGAVPAVASFGISYIEAIDQYLRTGTLALGFVIGLLTVFVKVRDLIKK